MTSTRTNHAPARYETGSHIGDYRVVQHLASGGMADVYLVTDSSGRELALKCLRAATAHDAEYALMFADEAELMSQLDHPNVVRAQDISHAKSDGFFTMEYVHGTTLLRTLTVSLRRHGALRLDTAVSIMLRVAAGIHYAHELRGDDGAPRGVIHRDISMANVLIGFDGSVKVADFGVAKTSDRELKTGENVIKGKIGYMSPEQCLGKLLDRRSDVFTLGILLYETTTGKKLFGGKSDYERLTKVVRGSIPKPSSMDRHYPADLEAVVLRALARDPENRYASAYEFLVALSKVKEGSLATSTADLASAVRELFSVPTDEEPEEPSLVYEWNVPVPPSQPTGLLAISASDTEMMDGPPVFDIDMEYPAQDAPRFGRNLALGTVTPPSSPPASLPPDLFGELGACRPQTAASPLETDVFLLHEANRRLSAGKYKAAMAAFTDVMELRPGDMAARAGYYVARGCWARVGGREQVAARYLRMAVDVAPARTDAAYWAVVLDGADEELKREMFRKMLTAVCE